MRSNRSRKHESAKTRKWPRWRRSLVRGGFLSSSIETPSSEARSIDVNRYSKNKLRLYVDRRFLGLRLLGECLASREKTQPDVWSTFNTKSLQGGALLGQKKYAEAEHLLSAGKLSSE